MKNKERHMEYALFDYKYQLNILKKENKELNNKIKQKNKVIDYLLKEYEKAKISFYLGENIR
tara:strand:+ start:968 stop:1153 length:186 start_codon:yes stop_codon:yes gene_type:complete